MFNFLKKKTYKITWIYSKYFKCDECQDIIKAYSEAEATSIFIRRHGPAAIILKIENIQN